jgi:hypothetical protein
VDESKEKINVLDDGDIKILTTYVFLANFRARAHMQKSSSPLRMTSRRPRSG